jgi:hypothetical protein
MIAGNRRAGGFLLALVLVALCLSVLAVFLMRSKTRRPLPGKSTISNGFKEVIDQTGSLTVII